MNILLDVRFVILLVVNIFMRFVFWLTYSPIISMDTGAYVRVAEHIFNWDWRFFTGARPVGYPLVLTSTYLGDHQINYYAVIILHFIFGILTAALLYWLLIRVTDNKNWAFFIVLLHSVSLNFLQQEMVVNTESFLALLMIGAMYGFERVRAQAVPSGWFFFCLALNISMLFLTRASAIVQFPVFLLMLWFYRNPQWSRRWMIRFMGIFAATVIVILLCWCYVVKSFSGSFSLTSMAGLNLTHQVVSFYDRISNEFDVYKNAYFNCRKKNPTWGDLECIADMKPIFGSKVKESELYRKLIPVNLRIIQKHPDLYLQQVVRSGQRVHNVTFDRFDSIKYNKNTGIPSLKFRSPEGHHVVQCKFFEDSLHKIWRWQSPLMKFFLSLFLVQFLFFILLILIKRNICFSGMYWLSVMMVLGNLLVSSLMETGQARFSLPLQPILFFSLGVGCWQGTIFFNNIFNKRRLDVVNVN